MGSYFANSFFISRLSIRKKIEKVGIEVTEQDSYVLSVVSKYKLSDTIDYYTQSNIIDPLSRLIHAWAGQYLVDIKLSGSRAKGDAISLSSDLDLFISLSSTTPYDLKYIYYNLCDYIQQNKIQIRKQNVSIGVTYQNRKIDLVPARRQDVHGNYHSLYKRKQDSWMQTNIDLHINNVRRSSRITEITALKIWKELHNLEFPSIYLETYALETLSGKNRYDYANNFADLLRDLATNFQTTRVVDPANTNNVLSDDLTEKEKEKIAWQAAFDLKKNWNQVIW